MAAPMTVSVNPDALLNDGCIWFKQEVTEKFPSSPFSLFAPVQNCRLSKVLSLSSSELAQRVEHRLAGDPDQPAKRLIQFQDQENGASHGEGRNHQGEDNSSIGRREHAKAEENNDEPGDKDDQHRHRNGGSRLRCQQRPKLAESCSEGYGLFLELALRVIVWRETLNSAIDYVAGLRVGSQVRLSARFAGPYLPHRFLDGLVKAGTSLR